MRAMLRAHHIAQAKYTFNREWRQLEPEVGARLQRGGGSSDDCGEISAAWYSVLRDHGHDVKMMQGSHGDSDHAWLVADGETFDPAPHTNPGVDLAQGWEH